MVGESKAGTSCMDPEHPVNAMPQATTAAPQRSRLDMYFSPRRLPAEVSVSLTLRRAVDLACGVVVESAHLLRATAGGRDLCGRFIIVFELNCGDGG